MDDRLNKETLDEKEAERPSFCSFKRAGRTFYIPVENLREVIEIGELFPVPLAPEYIKGAVPLRGSVIPVVDLSKIFNLNERPVEARILIVVDVLKESIGFLAEGLPQFVSSDDAILEEGLIDVNSFFETYMIKETS